MEILIKKPAKNSIGKRRKNTSKKVFKLSDFSFLKSQKNLESYKGSLSDAIIEDRGL